MRITGGIPVGGNLGYFNSGFTVPNLAVPLQVTPNLIGEVQERFDIAGNLPSTPFQQYVRPSSWKSIYEFAIDRISPHSLY